MSWIGVSFLFIHFEETAELASRRSPSQLTIRPLGRANNLASLIVHKSNDRTHCLDWWFHSNRNPNTMRYSEYLHRGKAPGWLVQSKWDRKVEQKVTKAYDSMFALRCNVGICCTMSLNQGKMLKIGNFIIRIFELLKYILYLMAYITFYTWFV